MLLLLGLMACVEREAWTPHADIMRDPVLTAWPDHEILPPPPLRGPGDRPDVTVYGYWPYWGDPLSTLYWDQLTDVAIFSVGLNADGSLYDTYKWTNNAATAMSLAAPHGVHVHLCVTSFSDSVTNSVLGSATYRQNAITNIKNLIDPYGAHGVNIDIEGLDASQYTNMVTFTQSLQAQVGEVFLAMPAVDWGGAWDYAALSDIADGLFIMGYDYHWSGGGPGPVAPLYGGSPWGVYAINWTIADYRYWGADDHKLILGLPLYGYNWPTTSQAVPGTATGSATSAVYSSAIATAATYGRRWDASTATPYTFPSSTRQLWYDDQASVGEKVQYAIDQGLQGFGFWALTYEDSDLAFWQMIDGKTHFGCADSDGDGTDDCSDGCPADPGKVGAGVCGCGVADTNQDGDAWLDCQESCDADPGKSAPGTCGCGVPDTDQDGDGWLDCQESCDADPGKSAPGTCGCGTPDEDITGDGVADCTLCGDGVVQAPEVCDDGARVGGDGCSSMCQPEAMDLFEAVPGTAGVLNRIEVVGVPTGDDVLFLAAGALGTTAIPGCPGLTAPLKRPVIIGMAQGSGGSAVLSLTVPAAAAGRSFAMVAVDLDGCRVSDIELNMF